MSVPFLSLLILYRRKDQSAKRSVGEAFVNFPFFDDVVVDVTDSLISSTLLLFFLFVVFVAFRVELDRTIVLGILIFLTVGIQCVRTLVVRTPTSLSFSDFSHLPIIIGGTAY